LETEAEKILFSVKNDVEMNVARKSLKPFISSILALSIEMQKAQKQDKSEEDVSEADNSADMANNLSAVGDLINIGEYEKARSVITGIEESSPEMMMFKLLDLITAKNYGEAENLANTLKEKHVEAITKFEGTDLSKKILAVDDMPEVLSFVKNALKSNYKIFGVTSGQTALKFLETHQADLFILDIDMPVMNGFELALTIRSMPDYANTPIIFLTGNSSRERIDRALEVGANDFIVKPASHDVLITKTGKFLKKVELAEQYSRMLERHEKDELTGLYGSNKFRDFIKETEKQAPSVGIIFFDVNGLKHYNDTVGHHAGDLLLKKAAESIDGIMDNARAFRTGGDEFVVVMPGCSERDIADYTEKWQRKLNQLNNKDDGIHCSIAAGSAFGEDQYNIGDLLKLADERMYAEKKRMKGIS